MTVALTVSVQAMNTQQYVWDWAQNGKKEHKKGLYKFRVGLFVNVG